MGLYKPTRAKNQPGAKWYGSYRDPETGRWKQKCLHTADKQAAKIRLAALERKASLKMAGLDNPYESHERRALSEHLVDWRRSLVSAGRTEAHADMSHGRAVRVLVTVCKFKTTREIVASDVQACIAELTRKGGERLSARTRNGYLGSCRQFTRWLVRDRRAGTNPLAHLSAENERVDRRRIRRAMTAEELPTLLNATKDGPDRYAMTGTVRYWLYRLASETGLRMGECRSLT